MKLILPQKNEPPESPGRFIVLTTNRGVASWGDTTVAAAMLDRLLHRSVVLALDGDSYRLRDHQARSRSLRTAATGLP